MHMLKDNSYDGGFAFEATCHAKDPVCVYKEIFRLLKPGSIYVDCAWVMTDTYNPDNPVHEKVKQDVMVSAICVIVIIMIQQFVVDEAFNQRQHLLSWFPSVKIFLFVDL